MCLLILGNEIQRQETQKRICTEGLFKTWYYYRTVFEMHQNSS